ncbi:MAG: pyridoxal-phosphate dependent enzyme [Polyangiaceae bacterium]|nr:pyridoxal-phosphate dependent enzyme [Polyangiaceae bacterium]
MPIYEKWSDAVGRTPLVRLCALDRELPAKIAVKLEYLNPLGSMKDRIAVTMLEEAVRSGALRPGMTVVEATNGNTGIALAAVCACWGYPIVVVMPESMSLERRILLTQLGARVCLTPAELGLVGAFAKVSELVSQDPSFHFINQGANAENPRAHYRTADEIWQDTAGAVDIVVQGVGTGGSFRGLSDRLRGLKPNLRMIAVEPEESAVLSGGERGVHAIPGIGPGIVPPMLEGAWPDAVEKVSTDLALVTARRMIAEEGIPAGISSGAMMAAALRVASEPSNAGKLVVTFAPSQVERYLTTPLADEARARAARMPVLPIDPIHLEAVKQQQRPFRETKHETIDASA